MDQFPSVGIGILNWNGRHYLQKFLHYLYRVTYPNVAIYVIDNNSTDDSIEYLKQHHPSVKIISTGGNYGVAGGYNRGFAQMPEKYLLMLNSDVEVTPNFLEPLVALMEADETIAITQTKLLAYDHKTMFEHGGAAGGMMDIFGYSFCRGRIFDTVEPDELQYKTGDIFWAGGACCLIRKSAYKRVGGMYEYYFMHFEEIDMCWRMHALGYRVICSNESVAYHVGGGTLSYQSPRKTYLNFRNNLIMCYRNSLALYTLWWLPLRCVFDQAAVLNYAIKGDLKNALAVWKGYGGFIKWLFTVKQKPVVKRSIFSMPGVLRHSILWLYFIRGRRTYSSINTSKK
jgi:GT2 family glycosyltransferase